MNKDMIYQVVTAIAVAIGGYGTGRLQGPAEPAPNAAQQPAIIERQIVNLDFRVRVLENKLSLPSPTVDPLAPYKPGDLIGKKDGTPKAIEKKE